MITTITIEFDNGPDAERLVTFMVDKHGTGDLSGRHVTFSVSEWDEQPFVDLWKEMERIMDRPLTTDEERL